jgi:hypothetical protein
MEHLGLKTVYQLRVCKPLRWVPVCLGIRNGKLGELEIPVR